jgi:hypothetical protein
MLAALLDYVLIPHISHLVAFGYTLWALGILPGSKDPQIHDVFMDGGISKSLYSMGPFQESGYSTPRYDIFHETIPT